MKEQISDHAWKESIFNIIPEEFESIALEVFRFQYEHNILYRQYCNSIRVNISFVDKPEKIPFLPIQFFKTKEVITTSFEPEAIFESSGTTGSVNSRHLVKDISLYKESFSKIFNRFYGAANRYCVIGLLPSYLERKNSSLVFMVNELIRQSTHPRSGYYLYDLEKLHETLSATEKDQQRVLLIGVTYALIEFAEKFPMKLLHTIVMETGGMKGRGPELTREEVHHTLKQQFGIAEVHSEYGMTELLSQAYAVGKGIFNCPPWMKIILRADDDPFDISLPGKFPGKYSTGAVNIIDLANLYSCSFIATDDIGKLYNDGSFEIQGRLDNSDMRGCGLMIL